MRLGGRDKFLQIIMRKEYPFFVHFELRNLVFYVILKYLTIHKKVHIYIKIQP